ncbi:MAG: hypothetical protein IJS96_05240 [Schwartzia sp.]|nr:hypothetical protein [Schwartzia sp. (in: firmicutes)]
MKVEERPVKDWLAHLRRHPVPELLDETCLEVLAAIEAQYGGTISHGAGLEIRLGDEARYADYIMNIDTNKIPFVTSLWYEIDYAEFLKASQTGERIEPCLFANVDTNKAESEAAYWDAVLPVFLGEGRAARLRPVLEAVIAKLPADAYVKQIGTMTGRGELDIMRLVIIFSEWEDIAPGLAAVGWPGDTEAFRAATEPWKETKSIAVNLDIGETGVLPKIGVEVFSRWRHPLLVDRFIDGLVEARLCLPSKADALRRWIRIRPDGDPFAQTLISYFKLVYRAGRIAEVKAYLEQSPYVHHHYFDAYEQPVRIDFELSDGQKTMKVSDALARLWECTEEQAPMARLRQARFLGGEHYEHLDRLLEECRENGIRAEVVLTKNVGRARLTQMIEAGADGFLVDMNAGDGSALKALKKLCRMGFANVRARWFLHGGNVHKLEKAIRLVEKLGAAAFIVTGMKPCTGAERPALTAARLAEAAKTIRALNPAPEEANGNDNDKKEEAAAPRMEISVENCFSPLAAYLGGEDPKENPNRGVARGCEAGRTFLAVRVDGSLSPCRCLDRREARESIAAYWETSPVLKDIRREEMPASCGDCCYHRRCLPCPASEQACPLK